MDFLVGGFTHQFHFSFHIWDVILPIDSYFSRWWKLKTINHIFPWLTVSHRMFLSWLNPAFWGISQRSATREIVSSKNLIRNNKNILIHQSIQMKIVGLLFGVNSSWFLDAWSHESQCNPKTAIQSLTNSFSRSFEDISWIMVVFRNVTSCCPPTWMITFIGNPQHKRS